MFLSLESSGSGDQGTALIDVLDDIGLDRDRDDYRARHAQLDDHARLDDDDLDGPTDAVEPAGIPVVEAADEWDELEDFRFAVRPYTWTQGRTSPVQELAVETLVSTSVVDRDVTMTYSAEHAAIAGLCAGVRSVAEVAALLALPLGVVRVLLADMIDNGWVHVHRNPTESGDPLDLSLMERVRDGLYRL